MKSFRASKRGCRIPINPGLLGPTRSINKPITFRSKRVKKATESIINKHWINHVKKRIRKYWVNDIVSFED